MTKPGPKPKPPQLHAIDGTYRKDRHGELPENLEVPGDPEVPGDIERDLQPPKKLVKRKQAMWDQYIRNTPWLTEFDVPTAHIWVELQYEFEKDPKSMVASRIAQLRALSSELGLNYLVAGKLVAGKKRESRLPNDKHFD